MRIEIVLFNPPGFGGKKGHGRHGDENGRRRQGNSRQSRNRYGGKRVEGGEG